MHGVGGGGVEKESYANSLLSLEPDPRLDLRTLSQNQEWAA